MNGAQALFNAAYKLDTMIKVDETLCIHCGSCVRACPGGLIPTRKPLEVIWR